MTAQGEPPLNKDDQEWLDILAGKAASGTAHITSQEAQSLREAILATRHQESNAEPSEAGLERLLFRLRREGLLGKDKKRWLGIAPLMAMAATVLLAVGVTVISFRNGMAPDTSRIVSQDGEPVMRGVKYQTLFSPHPEALAVGIKNDFASTGVTLKLSKSGAIVYLEAELPGQVGAGAMQMLERHRLALPEDRKLLIEIRPRAGG